MKKLVHVVICLAFVLSIGCAAKSSQQKSVDMPDPHAGIFAQKCAQCHDLERVDEAHKTKTKVEMKEIIIRMQQKPNSHIDQDALEEILEYY